MVAGAVGVGPTELPDFGHYRIQELLGQGGMGVVHRAYDTVHQRVIALKRLPASVTDQDYRARFRRESRIVANLSHPNIVPVNEFGEIDGQLYLDMMLVEGIDLRRALGSGAVDQDRAIAILTQVAHALDAAHASGLVHRDVKPSNILIDADGHAYLADFGIARENSPDATRLTRSGDLVGSWDYMAPERLSGGQIDGRADQYALACVLFECLTGRLPHQAAEPAAKLAAHLLKPAPAPSVFVPTITHELDEVVIRGMAKDPARRFPTAVALMEAAESAAYSGNTVHAPAPTVSGPTRDGDQGRLVRAILRSTAVRQPTRLPHDYPPTCPYPGLLGFESADADWFHGRDHIVTDLLVRLAEQLDGGEPVVLVGASGAGKSSVLRAGVLPMLSEPDAPDQWPQVVLTPGADPINALATAVATQLGAIPAEWARTIRETPTEFGSRCAQHQTRPVIVVDQFEELFTHGVPETDRIAFATALAHARPALVLLAVRADLVERCIELTALMPALTAPVLLGPMDPTELRQAIVAPARDAGLEVEPGLPERLIADLGVRGEIGYDPGALPRLAHALRETWNHSDGKRLTLAAYRIAGGIDGAVARTAEEIHAALDPPGRQTLRTILLRLVTVFDDGGVARRRVDPRELTAVAGYYAGIVDRLISARLITVDATGARLSHEALLTAWPRFRAWIDEDRAGLIQHRRFADAVQVWVESGRHDDDLYRGVRLAALTTWLDSARDRVRLRPAELEFLARSNAAELAERLAARRRRLRGLVRALSVLLVVAGVATALATELRRNAQDERARADAVARQILSRQLAAEAALLRGVDPRRAAMDALGAWQAAPTLEARSALLGTRADHYRGRLNGHEDAVTSVALGGDGRVAATGGRDGSLRLWDVPNRRELAVLDDGDGWWRTVSMSADGRWLAAANPRAESVVLWNVPERKRAFTVPARAADTAISPDGRTFAAVTDRGLVVWDTATFAERGQFAVGTSIMLAYNQDGTLIAATNANNVEVYRVADGTKVATLAGHTDDVTSMAFNPTGAMLASSSHDGTVRLWDTQRWAETRVLSMSPGAPNTVTFSPDGTAVVAAGAGTDIYAWDPATGEVLVLLNTGNTTTFGLALSGDGHTLLSTTSEGPVTVWAFRRTMLGNRDSAVIGVAFQPGGTLLATTSGNGAVRLWDGATGDLVRRPAGHTDEAVGVAFSPDGTRLATAGGDGTVIVWDAATGAEIRRFTRSGSAPTELAFSPDGTTIAVAGRTSTDSSEDRDEILLLNATDLTLVAQRPTQDEPTSQQPNAVNSNYPTAVAFSPDGRTLAASLSAGRIVLWDLADPGAALTTLPGHDEAIALDVEFSPDGTILASGGSDRRARLWRVQDGQRIGALAHDSAVRRVAFSPDGATLATASQDPVVRTWDVRTREPLARLDRHGDAVNEVAFSQSGNLLASVGSDGVARLWDLDEEHATRTLCGLLDSATLASEWNAVGPNRGDPPRCP